MILWLYNINGRYGYSINAAHQVSAIASITRTDQDLDTNNHQEGDELAENTFIHYMWHMQRVSCGN
jgi:hypothetical protein